MKALYELIKKTHPDRLVGQVRKGDLSPLHPVPLDDQTAAELLAYARQQEAVKLTPPVLLSDHICYVYDGTACDLANELGLRLCTIERYMYEGAYWHKGAVLLPLETPASAKEGGEREVRRLVQEQLQLGTPGTRTITADIYKRHCSLTTDPINKRVFNTLLARTLQSYGIEQSPSVRIGERVARGYYGVKLQ